MKLIEDYYEDSAYSFLDRDDEEVDDLIEQYGSDMDLICHALDKKYPEEKYFVLVDFIEDNCGSFHIRIWER